MTSTTNNSVNTSGPQISVESALDLRNGFEVGPSATTQNLKERRVVQSSHDRDASDAPPLYSFADRENEPASNLSVGSRLDVGPRGRRELNGELPPGARHDASVEERGEVAELMGLPNPVVPAHSGDCNHHNTDVESLRAEVQVLIRNYIPYRVEDAQWAPLADLVRSAIAAAPPFSTEEAHRRLRIAFDFALWATEDLGLDVDFSIFNLSVISRYASLRCVGQRRREQRLRALASAAFGLARANATTPNADALSQPYAAGEFAAQDSWARGLKQQWRRRDAQMYIALGRGAGLESSEMIAARIQDFRSVDGALAIVVRGSNPRTVPVFDDQAFAIRVLVEEYGIDEHLLTWSTRQNSKVGMAFENQRTAHKPSTVRLRSTWIVRHLSSPVMLGEFLDAAGLTSTSTLNRYLPYVKPNFTQALSSSESEGGR